MTPNRSRLTVMPVLIALFTSVMNLAPLNIVRVDARGLGHEHASPWRRKSLFAQAASMAQALGRFGRTLSRLHAHTWFKPAIAGATLALMALLGPGSIFASPLIIGALTEGQHASEFLLGERADGGSRDNITVLSGQTLTAGAVVGRVKYGIGRVSIPTVVGTGNGTATVVFPGPEVEVGNYVLTCTAAASHGGVFSLTTPGGKTLPAFTMTGGTGATTAYTSRHINFSITDGSTDFIVGDVFTFVVSTTVPTVIGGTGTGVLSALSLGPDAKPGRYKINNDVVVANGGDMTVIGPDGDMVGGRFVWSASGSTASFTSRQINFTISDATDYIANNYFDVCVFNQLNGGKVVAWDPTTFDGRHRACGLLVNNVDAASGDLAGAIVTRDAAIKKGALQWAAAITSSQKESAYLDLASRGIIAR